MSRSLPVIGIPVALSPPDVEPGIPEKAHFQYVKESYINAVIAAGGMPLVIPAFDCGEDNLEMLRHYVTMMDGLLLPGGGDPDAVLWGEENTHGININPRRDAIEVALCRRCFAAGIPILGICRGIQMIAVALGGDIWQDYSLGDLADHRTGSHDIAIHTDTRLHGMLDTTRMTVNTGHHQVLRKLPEDFMVTATSIGDNAVEAIEYAGGHNRYVVGVQWHPEDMDHTHAQAIYGSFISACTQGMG